MDMQRKLEAALDLVRDQIDVKDLLIGRQQEEIVRLEERVEDLKNEIEELQNDLFDANEALDLCETEVAETK